MNKLMTEEMEFFIICLQKMQILVQNSNKYYKVQKRYM